MVSLVQQGYKFKKFLIRWKFWWHSESRYAIKDVSVKWDVIIRFLFYIFIMISRFATAPYHIIWEKETLRDF